jgi:hypothetical protein
MSNKIMFDDPYDEKGIFEFKRIWKGPIENIPEGVVSDIRKYANELSNAGLMPPFIGEKKLTEF